ncbi:hypothetical protein [Bacillus sp. AK128]
MNKMVSMNVIEHAFDEVLGKIDQMEKTVESQTEIEINQIKLAQQEKILFVNEQLVRLEGGMTKKKFERAMPLKVVFSR